MNIKRYLPRETKKRQHKNNKRTSGITNRSAEAAEIPRTWAEPIADKKHTDRNGNGERNEGRNCADGKESTNRNVAGKNKQQQSLADSNVEPHRIYGGSSNRVDLFPVTGERETSISGISVCNTSFQLVSLLFVGKYMLRPYILVPS